MKDPSTLAAAQTDQLVPVGAGQWAGRAPTLGPAGVEAALGCRRPFPSLPSNPLEWRAGGIRGNSGMPGIWPGTNLAITPALSWQGELPGGLTGAGSAADWSGAARGGSSALRLDLQLLGGSPWLRAERPFAGRLAPDAMSCCGSSCPCSRQAFALGGGHLWWRAGAAPPGSARAAGKASRWEVPAKCRLGWQPGR